MFKYLFVCTENIGRSQMAEGYLNKKLGGNYAISAGVIDSSRKYNGHPRPDVIQVMSEIGVDVSGQTIKQITDKMLDKAEKIIVFCDKDVCPKYLTDKSNVVYAKVEDPPDHEKTIEVLRSMRDAVVSIVDDLQYGD